MSSSPRDSRIYEIALSLVPQIGPVLSRKLVAHTGSAEEVFRQSKKALRLIPGIGEVGAQMIQRADVMQRAEEELAFIDENEIELLFFTSDHFPSRLRECADGPLLLYHMGNSDFENTRILSVVGTRRITGYGKERCEQLIADLAGHDILIVSGLAYGVDYVAHKAALAAGLQTTGVLAHGLDRIYPSAHRGTAKKMVAQGGLLTEFTSRTNPDKENFPKRNRIVAGLADATVVIESGSSGGSLITAEIANSYSREVFAYPGRVTDEFSAGCNLLIKKNKAVLVESGKDILDFMGWDNHPAPAKKTASKTITLSADETRIVELLRGKGAIYIDEITLASGFASGKTAALLLQLEIAGAVKSLPGKMFRLIS